MKLFYTKLFGDSLSDSDNMWFSLLLLGKKYRERKRSPSRIIKNLTFLAFCNINVSGDNSLRKIYTKTFRGSKW